MSIDHNIRDHIESKIKSELKIINIINNINDYSEKYIIKKLINDYGIYVYYLDNLYNKCIRYNLKIVLKKIFDNEFLVKNWFNHLIFHRNFIQLETIINDNIDIYPEILNYLIYISEHDQEEGCELPYWEYNKDINKIKVDVNFNIINGREFKIKYINKLPNENITKYQDYIYYHDIEYKMDGKIIYDIFKQNSIYDNIDFFFNNDHLYHFLAKYLLENKLYDEYMTFINDTLKKCNEKNILFKKRSAIESLVNYSNKNKNICYFDRIKYILYIKT
jgi:hypothetical protein